MSQTSQGSQKKIASNQVSKGLRQQVLFNAEHEHEHERLEVFEPLSRVEAQALLTKINAHAAPLSLVRVAVWQALVGVLLAICLAVWFGNARVGWSSFYGSLCVVVPAAIFARAFSRQVAGGVSKSGSATAIASFFVWETVKVVLTVAMLLAAPKVVFQLNWLALLAGFVVTMKVYLLAAWVGLRHKNRIKK